MSLPAQHSQDRRIQETIGRGGARRWTGKNMGRRMRRNRNFRLLHSRLSLRLGLVKRRWQQLSVGTLQSRNLLG